MLTIWEGAITRRVLAFEDTTEWNKGFKFDNEEPEVVFAIGIN